MKLALDAWQDVPEGTIHTIPVRIDDCQMPESFQPYQRADLFESQGFDRIVYAIRTELAKRQIVQTQPPSMHAPSSGAASSPMPNQTETGIKASPMTVRIYALGPPDGAFGPVSWTTEHAKAKERWDAFWKSHSAGQDGIPTNPAEYLSRYRAIRSGSHGNSPSSKTTSHTHPPGNVSSGLEGLASRQIRKMDDLDPAMFIQNIAEFDEHGVGFMVIRKDQLLNYCRSLPVVRRF